MLSRAQSAKSRWSRKFIVTHWFCLSRTWHVLTSWLRDHSPHKCQAIHKRPRFANAPAYEATIFAVVDHRCADQLLFQQDRKITASGKSAGTQCSGNAAGMLKHWDWSVCLQARKKPGVEISAPGWITCDETCLQFTELEPRIATQSTC